MHVQMPTNGLTNSMMNRNRYSRFQIIYPVIKRLGDIFASLLLLLIAGPLLIIVAIWIKLSSQGGVFFSQVRTGRNNCPFRIYKFRTMIQDSENCGPLITSGDDDRITPFGRILRRTKMDELPQLFNVLKGDMSLVGPRPDVPVQRSLYSDADWAQRCSVRPGITGLAQALLRSEGTEAQRLELDLRYVRQCHLWLDLKIMWWTLARLTGKGSN